MKIKCVDCKKEYDSKLKSCPKCGCPTTYNYGMSTKKKILYFIIPIVIIVALLIIPTIRLNQSNEYDEDIDQLVIDVDYLNLRDDHTIYSNKIGEVYYGERFDILEEDDGWYRIRTRQGQEGWILGSNGNAIIENASDKEDEREENSILSKKKNTQIVDNRTPLERLNDTLKKKGYTTSDNKVYTYYFTGSGSTFMDTFDMKKNEYSKFVEGTDYMYMTYVTTYNYKTNKVHYEMLAKVMGYTQTLVIDWDLNTEKYTWKGDFDKDYVENTVSTTLDDTQKEFHDILNSANVTVDDLLQ